VLALTAAATQTIRIGSGAVQLGHRTALSVVEEFGLLDALHPGRLDLGLGRSGGRPSEPGSTPAAGATPVVDGGRRTGCGSRRGTPRTAASLAAFRAAEDPTATAGRRPQDYAAQIDDILALLSGTYRAANGEEAHIVPGEGADIQVWILGSSGGASAQVAGANGLRFASNYHVSPATVLEAADAYRAAFRPSVELDQPYVSVSADVVVAPDEATARELATGYGLWVRSIRSGEGAIAFPTPDQARAHVWSDEDRTLVADRVETQFVGSPKQVADQLGQLQEATGADELIITTITHDHADRVRSYELLAQEWERR